MDYKYKYLKYKKKYFDLKAGEIKCPQKGFIQHQSECWHDSSSMIILFTDELSNDIQEVFNNWILDPSHIDIFFEEKYAQFEERKHLLPPNIDELTEDIKIKIKSYILNLFNRYKKEFEYHKSDLPEDISAQLRQISLDTSLSCVQYSYNLNAINIKDKYKHIYDFDINHTGSSPNIFINISVINFIFAKTKIIRMIDINIENIKSDSKITLEIVKELINKCNAVQYEITVMDKTELTTSLHSNSSFICNGKHFLHDNEKGYKNKEITITELNWKEKLLSYFISYETLKNINEYVYLFRTVYSKDNIKSLDTLTFYYLDNVDSENYYYSPSLHIYYKNQKSIDFWNKQLINILNDKNKYYINYGEIYSAIYYDSFDNNIIDILLDKNIIDTNLFKNLYKHKKYEFISKLLSHSSNILFDKEILEKLLIDMINLRNYDLVDKIIKREDVDVNNIKTNPILYAFNTGDRNIINLFLSHPKFDYHKVYTFGNLLHAIVSNKTYNDISKYLINDKKIDINVVNDYGYLPIHETIKFDNEEIFNILLQQHTETKTLNQSIIDKINEYIETELEEDDEDDAEEIQKINTKYIPVIQALLPTVSSSL